jgi:endonuclease III
MNVEAIQRVQRRLAIKAYKDKDHQFENLMSLVRRPDWIEYAIRKVLCNSGC